MADNSIGVYSVPTSKMVLEVIAALKAMGYIIHGGQKTRPIPSAPRIHLGVVTENITRRTDDTAGMGRVALRQIKGIAGTDDSIEAFPPGQAAEIDVYGYGDFEVEEETYIQLIREYASGKWAMIPPECPRITAILEDGNDFEDETMADPHTGGTIAGINREYHGDETVDLYNPQKIKLWEGCSVRAEWNITEDRWEIYLADSDMVVHGIKREDCTFKKLDGYMGWHDWNEGAEADWVTDVLFSEGNCLLTVTKCGEDPVDYDLNFITDLYKDGCSLVYEKCNGDVVPVTTLDFAVHVGASPNSLYYVTCSGTHHIIDIGPCPDGPCGTIVFEARKNPANGQLEWVAITDTCESPCEGVLPTDPPQVEGEHTTTTCQPP